MICEFFMTESMLFEICLFFEGNKLLKINSSFKLEAKIY